MGGQPRQSGEKKPKSANLTGGSRKGRPNRVTAELKEMILAALDGAGGVDYLQEQAAAKPAAFLALVGKVLPLTIKAEHRGSVTIVVPTNATALDK